MREDNSISLYRDRLDKTLSSHDLTDMEALGNLVKDQMLRSSKVENEDCIKKIVENRTKEVSHFLGMLRSASMDDVQRSKLSEASQHGWKVKQDTEEYRVMYREGPEGTPFHTLLVEGYVDGPLDVCLCISWEVGLYPKWWPQITVPCFKLITSQCLKKVTIGEQICLARMKLSWPLSTREAVIHYFEFEYLQDGLLVVLLNSISDLDSINRSTHGFTRDGIPDAQDVIRIDVVGGFALQKVSANRSYFRTIANVDVKMDFVPPAFINFVSRQLIGSGFKLYKKEVASVSKGDEDFAKSLNDPLYTRIRQSLYSNGLSNGASQLEDTKNGSSFLLREHSEGKDEVSSIQERVHNGQLADNSQAGVFFVEDKKSHGEIEEIEENDDSKSCNSPTNHSGTGFCTDNKKVVICPEVEKALRMLDDILIVFREYKSNDVSRTLPGIPNEDSQNLENNEVKDGVSSSADCICRNVKADAQPMDKENPEMTVLSEHRKSSDSHGSRRTQSTTYSRDANHNKIAPASPSEDVLGSYKTDHAASLSSQNQRTEVTLTEKTTMDANVLKAGANGVDGNKGRSKNRKARFCCFSPPSLQF